MTQPTVVQPHAPIALQAVNPETLMLRVADEIGITADEMATAPRTSQWMGKFRVLQPCPGELGQIYVIFALFHGCKGRDEDRVPQEQRVYLFPKATGPGGPPFMRLTYVPAWWGNDARHEVMGQDEFIEEVAEEYALLLDLDEDAPETEPETPETAAQPVAG